LNIEEDAIGVEGAKFIAESLKVNQSLTNLHLEVSAISDDNIALIGIAEQRY